MADKIATPAGEIAVRESFGAEELVGRGLSPEAAAAAAKAEIEVRAILAERHPRGIELFRQRILEYCKNPDFAEWALYCKKVGRKQNAEGQWEDAFAINFSIRFIEAAFPLFKNIFIATRIIHEDDKRLVINVQVYDAENNAGYGQDAILPKLVERKEAKDRTVRGVRMNSRNEQIYIVEATKDEMRNVLGAERSKLIRDQGQKLLPFHILAEARRLIEATNANENAKDPNAAKNKVLDKFAALGVTPEMLREYLNRPNLDGLTLADLHELGVLHNGLKEGEFTWAELVRMKVAPAENEPPAERERRDTFKEKIKAARDSALGGKEG